MSDEVLETPCQACGLCCNGTLYSRAKVAPGEEARIADYGLTLQEFDGKIYFRLPCKYLNCSRCTIYEKRFEICRSFECDLLRRFKANEISLDEALKTVDTARELLAKVMVTDPGAQEYADRLQAWSVLTDEIKGLDGNSRRDVATRQLQILALDTYLERHFRNKKRKFR